MLIHNNVGEKLLGVLDNTRFIKLFESGGDRSFLNRLLEVQDVLHIVQNEATWAQRLFGFGHGATFTPVFSFPEPNVTENHSVHNIHINLFLWLYRYGIVGVGFYSIFVVLTLWHSLKLLMMKQADLSPADIAFTLGSMIIVIRSIFYSPINDPINLFVISGFCYSLWVRKRRNRSRNCTPPGVQLAEPIEYRS